MRHACVLWKYFIVCHESFPILLRITFTTTANAYINMLSLQFPLMNNTPECMKKTTHFSDTHSLPRVQPQKLDLLWRLWVISHIYLAYLYSLAHTKMNIFIRFRVNILPYINCKHRYYYVPRYTMLLDLRYLQLFAYFKLDLFKI